MVLNRWLQIQIWLTFIILLILLILSGYGFYRSSLLSSPYPVWLFPGLYYTRYMPLNFDVFFLPSVFLPLGAIGMLITSFIVAKQYSIKPKMSLFMHSIVLSIIIFLSLQDYLSRGWGSTYDITILILTVYCGLGLILAGYQLLILLKNNSISRPQNTLGNL